jgi:hypothetical protein
VRPAGDQASRSASARCRLALHSGKAPAVLSIANYPLNQLVAPLRLAQAELD